MFSFSVQSRPWMMENPERWIQKRKQTNPREAEQGQQTFNAKIKPRKYELLD